MKAEDLVKLIRQRYPLDRPSGYQSHVVLEQVPDGTGMHQGHWIDAVVLKGLSKNAKALDIQKRYAETVALILNWDKEFGSQS